MTIPPACPTLLHVVGTRPNFMKVASVMAAVERWNAGCAASEEVSASPARQRLRQVLVHTGQHYDERMSRVFFHDLRLPEPDYYLGVGSGTHAEQTARIMLALEPVVERERPDLVVVVGDVNSTLAAALVAAKLRVPVAHVEAGLRSRDRAMPEELNRLVTDQLADLLFTTSRDADANLAVEGIASDRIFLVGNTMIDTLDAHLPKALEGTVLDGFNLDHADYAVATLHRPSNVDDLGDLERLARALARISERLPVIFPVHARTRANLQRLGLWELVEKRARLILTEPLGYLDFLSLLAQARLVLTDSGGIQEETTVLGVPCLTLRTTTERPVTIWEGTNRLVDPYDEDAVVDAAEAVLAAPAEAAHRPELWDGRAGDRIVSVLAEWLRRGIGVGGHTG
ncbi:MAG: UDP-N-acetylglucosamine 2-epimerase (non-hydrolyzing) [Gaiellales bacterium]|nr:UDP-N-acetylglucosamine 2-epimerase (non-hydrolyzing) [Gaiellales bacterium]